MSSRWARDFADLLGACGIARYYAYPKTPKMNAHAERFNRTVQKEFLDYHEDLLWGDEANLALLNRKLGEWLLGYSGERPHEALGLRTPIAALARERSALDHLLRPRLSRAAKHWARAYG